MGNQRPDAANVASLRALTYRISNTPGEKLPQVAPQIAAALWNCRDLLSAPTDSKTQGDIAVLVHRFNTQISSLLQDQTVSGRWSAVVISKALIEAGGVEVLSKCNAWVRSLLAILKKPDPPNTRRLAVIVLTRIFVLTWEFSNLVREITTPALPTFISTCLNNVEIKRCSESELQTILDAFATLIARHTTIFRTNETAIRNLSSQILSATPSAAEPGVHYTQEHQSSARRLLVLLHGCAPKQGAGSKWEETLSAVVSTAHTTCDRLFRSVQEEWKSSANVQPSAPLKQLLDGEVRLESADTLGLSSWRGMHAGCERLMTVLALLQTSLEMPTSAVVSVRVGTVVDLLNRVLSIRVARGRQHEQLKANHEISNEERETLYSLVPKIHAVAIEACKAVLIRFGGLSVPMQKAILDMILYVFPSNQMHVSVREATYSTCGMILQSIGPALTKDDVIDIGTVLKAACVDILPDSELRASGVTLLNASPASGKSGPNDSNSGGPALATTCYGDVRQAAIDVVRDFLENVPAVCHGAALRTQVDRTAVLSQDKGLLLASVLNPSVKSSDGRVQPSLLPFLARAHPKAMEVESLIRPRLPPIRTGGHSGERSWVDDEDVLSADEEEDDPEITSDLLSALTQNAKPSSVPTQEGAMDDAQAQPSSHSVASKRPAEHDTASEIWSKRTKPSQEPDLSSSVLPHRLPEPTTSMEPVHTQSARAAHELATLIDGAAQAVVSASQSTVAGLPTGLPAEGINEEDGDSDVGTPPLTMEPDTDSEEEDDEGDEDGT